MSSILSLKPALPKNNVMLPYEVINKILDYISHLNNEQFRMNVDYEGRISFRINVWFSGYLRIHQVNMFKQFVRARQVRLRLSIWPNDAAYEEVDALEEPRRICDQENADADLVQGFIHDARCYTYTDLSTGEKCHAYVSCRYYFNDNYIVFRHGEVYTANGEIKSITGFGSDAQGIVHLTVSPMNLWWFDNQPMELEILQALLELGDDDAEDVDFQENHPAIDMYM